MDFATIRYLYLPPSPAQCATDMIPLMSGFTASKWYNFRRGYLAAWPDGVGVFDLVENGDLVGWRQAWRQQDYPACLSLIDRALDDANLIDLDRVPLLDKRAQCLLHLDRPAEAVEVFEHAISLLAGHDLLSHELALTFNLAVVHSASGHTARSAELVDGILAYADDPRVDPFILEQARLLRDQPEE
ncbi:hypothetical protein Aph01nite_00060 [Acrocarpospora phusangensis]|uniref:Tetratricopeptide repeat protein n=1 Tax=Acrocarpospora phusangensis TaxID=1070424 RepID=A0A919Q4Y0_9ACTN|nr:hypothetical protein [Acrocarpospora phusangensis]GIH21696.1 hypothetical protein Aph01nite_00060 [Acrocarpospora phusangensis]